MNRVHLTSEKFVLRREFFGGLLFSILTGEYSILEPQDVQKISEAGISFEKHGQLDIWQTEIHSDLIEIGLNHPHLIRFVNESVPNHLSAPLRVFLDITYDCNLECIHCYTSSGIAETSELTTKEIFGLIDQMHHCGAMLLSIAGGEPFMRPDIFEIVEYARSFGIQVSVTTNGTKLNERILVRILKADFKTITVSVDGNEIHNDTIRGKGSYTTVKRNLKEITKKSNQGTCIAIKTTLNNLNIHDAEDILALAEDVGVGVVKFNPIRLLGRSLTNHNLDIKEEEYSEFLNAIQKIKTNIKVVFPKTPLDDEPYNCVGLGFGCTGGKETCNITPTGDLSPCAFLGIGFKVGNLREMKFLKLWRSVNEVADYHGNKTCNECLEYSECRGGCRSRALTEYGNVNGIDPFCTQGKAVKGKLTIIKYKEQMTAYDHESKQYSRYTCIEKIDHKYPRIFSNQQYRHFVHSFTLPLKLFIDVTNECNSSCIHCFNISGEAYTGELNTEEFLDLAGQISDMGICQVSISGGEPFTRADLFMIVDRFLLRHVDVSITTNGLLIDHVISDKIAQRDIKSITISIDAIDQVNYQKIRGNGNFELLKENINYLRSVYDGELSMRMSLIKTDYNVEEIIRFAERLGFDSLKINKTHSLGRFRNCDELLLEDEDYDLLINEFRYISSNTLTLELPREKYLNHGKEIKCTAGIQTMYISPVGEIFPCSFIGRDFCIGSIRENTLEELVIRLEKFSLENDHCQHCPANNPSHHITEKKLIE